MVTTITPTAEQQHVLEQEQAPVFIVNAAGSATHVVLPIAEARRWFDEYVRRELQIGFDQAERGDVGAWDIEATLAEARRRFAARKTG